MYHIYAVGTVGRGCLYLLMYLSMLSSLCFSYLPIKWDIFICKFIVVKSKNVKDYLHIQEGVIQEVKLPKSK